MRVIGRRSLGRLGLFDGGFGLSVRTAHDHRVAAVTLVVSGVPLSFARALVGVLVIVRRLWLGGQVLGFRNGVAGFLGDMLNFVAYVR